MKRLLITEKHSLGLIWHIFENWQIFHALRLFDQKQETILHQNIFENMHFI